MTQITKPANAQTRLPGYEIGRLDTFPVQIGAFLKIIPIRDDLGQKSKYFSSWICETVVSSPRLGGYVDVIPFFCFFAFF